MHLIISVNNSNIKCNFRNTNHNDFPYSLVCYNRCSLSEKYEVLTNVMTFYRFLLLQSKANFITGWGRYHKTGQVFLQS